MALYYRREIDGLRAVAVVPVVLFHAGFETFSGGYVGVDIFFVISGYLITSIILTEQVSGRFSLIRFYERRARRILPALFLVLAVCTVLSVFVLTPRDLRTYAQSLISVLLFSSNIFFWRDSGYFDSAAELKPLLHTWSLAVEEQFYLLFPLMLLGLGRLSRRAVSGWIGALAALSLALAQWTAPSQPTGAFFLLPTRAWELLLGALLAIHLTRPGLRDPVISTPPHPAHNAASALGLLLILGSVLGLDRYAQVPGVIALVPTLGAALIVMYATPKTWVGRCLSSDVLVRLGLISYSAYLWHQPIFAFSRHLLATDPGALVWASLASLSFGLAYVSWRFVEVPCRRADFLTRSQLAAWVISAMAVLGAVGLTGYLTDGLQAVKGTADHRRVAATALPSPKRAPCHAGTDNRVEPLAACQYFEGPARWAVFGDSHAVELAYAVAEQLRPHNLSLKHFSFGACPPTFPHVHRGALAPCADWTLRAASAIASDPVIDTVVVSYRIHAALFGEHSGRYPGLPDEVGRIERERRWTSYLAVMNHFVQQGKRVVLVLQAPELPRPMDRLLFDAENPAGQVWGASRHWWQQRSAFVASRLSELPPGVVVVDPASALCGEKACLAADAGTALYYDSDHLSVAGARRVASTLAERVPNLVR